ncbi:alpha-amylase family glycosyl hydrolase [Pseudothermotoga thermarum]|uniref:Maltodextrin glycosyltransferase n=1 Tax=Pseudothermotoga thermarum DSM 5069 TaxID=688269 RepID=F7YX10_9THEM|nr:alpha-amylase family glycosyl hydrolase [Pseudothermotoga thermarum]AEH50605.1 maltodextrin glycosyltransferase [Pseudothermotoga thermarum DSM 5069]
MVEEIKKSIRQSKSPNYCIPKAWFFEGYKGSARFEGEKVYVEPASYFQSVCDWILSFKKENVDYNKSIALLNGENDRSWIRKSVIYSCLARTTAAFNHKGFGRFEQDDILGYRESGTFLKMIALLPHLVRLGVNAIYLLPITKSSNLFKKGEIGSPYSVKDFLKLDDLYHDPLLEGWKVEDEFAAFVEACHILGIRVLLDFIPRTAARDCNLILSHPEWFYWIKLDELSNYKPPAVPELGFCQPSFEVMKSLYDKPQVQEHLRKFTFDPKTIDPNKWEKLLKVINEDNFIFEIAKEYGIVTAPGFSDWLNDPQPTWDDVTFLRLYLDHPQTAAGKVSKDHPPYVLFDVIKASRFPGKEPNVELWNYIASIIPYFQKKFGIDGMRLDMGHALPDELEQMIIKNARDYDPGFVFIAEELEMHRAREAKEAGYDAIIGNSWWMLPRVPDKTYEFFQKIALEVDLPYIAACETPDTPRVVARNNGEKLKYLLPFLCAFAPNGIYTVNSGQEIEEKQPMNLGLDNDFCGRYMLPCEDEFNGKLAFFDHFVLHWKETDLMNFLSELAKVRKDFLNLIVFGQYKPVYLSWQDGKFVNASYWEKKEGIVVLANLSDESREVSILVDKTIELPGKVKRVMVWDGKDWQDLEASDRIDLKMPSFGYKLCHIIFS